MSENHTTEISITFDDIQDGLGPLFISELIEHELAGVEDIETDDWDSLFADGEFYFEVDYEWDPGCAGSMYSRNGDPGDPPEPETYDINSAIMPSNNKVLIARASKAKRIMSKYKKKLKTRHSLRKQLYGVSRCDEIDMSDYIDESEIISLIENNGMQ